MLERALVALPNMPVANMQYGIAQARLKHFDKAIPPLQKAVSLQPDNGMGHYEFTQLPLCGGVIDLWLLVHFIDGPNDHSQCDGNECSEGRTSRKLHEFQ